MPQLPNGVVYWVAAGSTGENPTGRHEHWVKGINQTTEVLHVAWGDWPAFVLALVGSSNWQSQGSSGYLLRRSLPVPHPRYPWMIPVDVELLGVTGTPAPFGDIGQFAIPAGISEFTDAIAVAQVTYRSILYNAFRDDTYVDNFETALGDVPGELLRYVDKRRVSRIQSLAVEGTRFKWVDTGVEFNDQAQHGGVLRRYKFAEWEYRWHEVPAVLDDFLNPVLPPQLLTNWKNIEGNINDDQFDIFPQGTALCGAVQFEPIISATGAYQYEVVIPILEQKDGWNNKFRATAQNGTLAPGFYAVQGVFQPDASNPSVKVTFDPYTEVSFDKLFQAI